MTYTDCEMFHYLLRDQKSHAEPSSYSRMVVEIPPGINFKESIGDNNEGVS